jgi:pantothenate kinase
LILPWVKVKNLASKVLSISAKEIQKDWENYYKYKPVLIETFVHAGKFIGTCYKAANWVYLGRTQGKGRCGMNYFVHNQPKDIYVYSLCRNYLKLLKCK